MPPRSSGCPQHWWAGWSRGQDPQMLKPLCQLSRPRRGQSRLVSPCFHCQGDACNWPPGRGHTPGRPALLPRGLLCLGPKGGREPVPHGCCDGPPRAGGLSTAEVYSHRWRPEAANQGVGRAAGERLCWPPSVWPIGPPLSSLPRCHLATCPLCTGLAHLASPSVPFL